MGLEDIQEGAANPTIPFVGSADLSVAFVVSLVVGLTLLAIIRPMSESLADMVSDFVANLTGINPKTAQSASAAPLGGGA